MVGEVISLKICALKAVILNYTLHLVSTSLRLSNFFFKVLFWSEGNCANYSNGCID